MASTSRLHFPSHPGDILPSRQLITDRHELACLASVPVCACACGRARMCVCVCVCRCVRGGMWARIRRTMVRPATFENLAKIDLQMPLTTSLETATGRPDDKFLEDMTRRTHTSSSSWTVHQCGSGSVVSTIVMILCVVFCSSCRDRISHWQGRARQRPRTQIGEEGADGKLERSVARCSLVVARLSH